LSVTGSEVPSAIAVRLWIKSLLSVEARRTDKIDFNSFISDERRAKLFLAVRLRGRITRQQLRDVFFVAVGNFHPANLVAIQ